MPRTEALDYHWYDTPNIHLCTIADFVDLAREQGRGDRPGPCLEDATACEADMRSDAWGPNLLAQGAIFLLRRA